MFKKGREMWLDKRASNVFIDTFIVFSNSKRG